MPAGTHPLALGFFILNLQVFLYYVVTYLTIPIDIQAWPRIKGIGSAKSPYFHSATHLRCHTSAMKTVGVSDNKRIGRHPERQGLRQSKLRQL